MTKKDYILIASALQFAKPSKVAKPNGYLERLEAWHNTVEVLAGELKKQNPLFNFEKFYKACDFDGIEL